MFYHNYIKIQTNINDFNLDSEGRSVLRDALNEHFKSDYVTFALNIINEKISFMLESNGCISMEFKTKVDSDEDMREFYRDNLLNFFSNSFEWDGKKLLIDKEAELTTTYCNFDMVLNFESTVIEPIVTSLNEIPENTKTIEFTGVFPETSTADMKVNIKFKNINDDYFEANPEWIAAFNELIKNNFNADSQFKMNLGHMFKALFGSYPSQEITKAYYNEEFLIDTERFKEDEAGLNTKLDFQFEWES